MLIHYTINSYAKKAKATRAAVESMIEEGLLQTIKSEAGRVTYILVDENDDVNALRKEVSELKSMMAIFMNHFGVKPQGGAHA